MESGWGKGQKLWGVGGAGQQLWRAWGLGGTSGRGAERLQGEEVGESRGQGGCLTPPAT